MRAPDRTRTCNLGIRRPLLYPLSYGGDVPSRAPHKDIARSRWVEPVCPTRVPDPAPWHGACGAGPTRVRSGPAPVDPSTPSCGGAGHSATGSASSRRRPALSGTDTPRPEMVRLPCARGVRRTGECSQVRWVPPWSPASPQGGKGSGCARLRPRHRIPRRGQVCSTATKSGTLSPMTNHAQPDLRLGGVMRARMCS